MGESRSFHSRKRSASSSTSLSRGLDCSQLIRFKGLSSYEFILRARLSHIQKAAFTCASLHLLLDFSEVVSSSYIAGLSSTRYACCRTTHMIICMCVSCCVPVPSSPSVRSTAYVSLDTRVCSFDDDDVVCVCVCRAQVRAVCALVATGIQPFQNTSVLSHVSDITQQKEAAKVGHCGLTDVHAYTHARTQEV